MQKPHPSGCGFFMKGLAKYVLWVITKGDVQQANTQQREYCMRILGIVASDGDAAHIKEMAKHLKESLFEIRNYWRKNSEPQINWVAREMHTKTNLTKLAEEVRSADGVLFAVYTQRQHQLENFIDLLANSAPFHDETLRGKWIGFILLGTKTTLGLETTNGRLLAKANSAGLVPLPQSFATLRGKRPKEHLRLARDMAKAISLQDKWNGFTVWQEAA